MASKIVIKDQIARNVATAYLGRDAGSQVLAGQIKRGDGEMTHAVIWYSDMHDSTAMADTIPPKGFLRVLNAYFECN